MTQPAGDRPGFSTQIDRPQARIFGKNPVAASWNVSIAIKKIRKDAALFGTDREFDGKN
ncbi:MULTISPECIES: hypothetical protein [unclassified Microcoleus]|uniref:hypothetical protein n=1 Tax=unclassified Microcoleus TaxID=2642155 RepID=UPI002FD07F43